MITLFYIPFCVFFAWLNHKWILKVDWENNKKIKHGINGAIHITAAILFAYFTEWYHFFTVLLITRVAFDWSLNLFRGFPLDYLPKKPKSIADKIEKELFGGNGLIGKLLCILFIVILLSC